MKKNLLLAIATVLAFVSCSKDADLFEGPQPELKPTAEDIKANFKNVCGVEYGPNQDWVTTTSGSVNVKVDASVKKVQLLVDVKVVEGASEQVTPNEIRVLNELEPNGRTNFTMYYDAPKANQGLYVGFLTDKTYVVKKLEGSNVTFDIPATSRVTRSASSYALPEGTFTLAVEETQFIEGHQNQYTHGKLYSLATGDYETLAMGSQKYSSDFENLFSTVVLGTFPNGKKDANGQPINNLPLVYAMGCFNEYSYGYVLDKDVPVIVTPVYKRDGAPNYGSEIYHSDFYYYYYNDADYNAASDKKAFLKALPKFKAIPFNQTYSEGNAEEGLISQRGSFALLYYGDGKSPIGVGTTGTFKFPVGTKIGFMVRAKTDKSPRKKGECYLDGRLNDFINTYEGMNFASSGFLGEEPRAAWFSLQNHLFLCWESGTDADFNDVILEVEGLGGIVPPPPYYPQVFTFCFEDTPKGDYDLNDIVVKAVRTSEKSITYYLAACGAHDSIFVKNINSGAIKDNVEVHAMFGVPTKTFINTQNGSVKDPISVTIPVDEKFSFQNEATRPYIYDATIDNTVKVSLAGEDPHGIMLPFDFDYPLEKVPVSKAYEQFNNWAKESITSTDWYAFPNESRVYSRKLW